LGVVLLVRNGEEMAAVVIKSTGRVAGRRNDACISVGHSADRGDAMGLCVQDLCLAVNEEHLIAIPHVQAPNFCVVIGSHWTTSPTGLEEAFCKTSTSLSTSSVQRDRSPQSNSF
jgi:hypothetical protein